MNQNVPGLKKDKKAKDEKLMGCWTEQIRKLKSIFRQPIVKFKNIKTKRKMLKIPESKKDLNKY